MADDTYHAEIHEDGVEFQYEQIDMSRVKSWRTAKGALNIDEFGEIVSKMWTDSHNSVPMWRVGSPEMDDTSFPHIVWRCNGRQLGERTPNKPRKVDKYYDEDNQAIDVVLAQYVSSFLVEVESNDVREAAQISREFELFMFEFVGVLKYLGLEEITFDRRFADQVKEISGSSVVTIPIQWTLTEQQIGIIKRDQIELVETILYAVTEYGEDVT